MLKILLLLAGAPTFLFGLAYWAMVRSHPGLATDEQKGTAPLIGLAGLAMIVVGILLWF
jgi:hypothetical protein